MVLLCLSLRKIRARHIRAAQCSNSLTPCSSKLASIRWLPSYFSFFASGSRRRFSSSNNNSSTTATTLGQRRYIPTPSWSIASLELDKQHAPATIADLEKLAKRAVIDLSSSSLQQKQQLCQDLGNMLHMMEQVKHDVVEHSGGNMIDCSDPVVLYDTPRGVSEAYCRDDSSAAISDREGSYDTTMSAAVRKSLWEPKMKRLGAHQYFEIVTDITVVPRNQTDAEEARRRSIDHVAKGGN